MVKRAGKSALILAQRNFHMSSNMHVHKLGVVSVSCGIDRVLPVLRPVCVTHSCPLACMCVCVWEACRVHAP